MGDFTPERKREYVASGGVLCPGCGSDNLVGGDLTVTDGMVCQDVRCFGCNITFTDVYRLDDVQTEEFTDPDAPAGSREVTSASAAAGTVSQVRREAQQT